MCPGESMRLMRYSFASGSASGALRLSIEKYSEMADDSIVIPRVCSSGLESKYRIFPASLGEIMPFVARRASVREVLPWSTWARMQIYMQLAELLEKLGVV